MTCQSSESTETIESSRRAADNTRAVESDESRVASAMRDLKNTGGSDPGTKALFTLQPQIWFLSYVDCGGLEPRTAAVSIGFKSGFYRCDLNAALL